jgi:hypothetical protein
MNHMPLSTSAKYQGSFSHNFDLQHQGYMHNATSKVINEHQQTNSLIDTVKEVSVRITIVEDVTAMTNITRTTSSRQT